ncbi:protein SPATA31F3 [Rhynchocyon petersi]
MLSLTDVQWDIDYSLYNFGSIFIIVIIIWQAKRIHHGLRLRHNRSCCWRQRKVRQMAREAASRARRAHKEEAEKPRKLLSLLKRQGWQPQEGGVRRLLCADPCCHICNDMALEIQHLLASENIPVTPTSAGAPQHSARPDNLSMLHISEPSLHLGAKHSKELSLASVTPTLLQLTEQKSLTQTSAASTGTANIQNYCGEHLPLQQEIQPPDVSWDSEALCSSNLEEPGVLLSQQQEEKSVLEKQGQYSLNPRSSHFL